MTEVYTVMPTAPFNTFYKEHSGHQPFKLIVKVETQGRQENYKSATILAQCHHDGIKLMIYSNYTKPSDRRQDPYE